MTAIVMYRNPIEEWWWESGAAFWVIGVLLGLIALFVIGATIQALWSRWRRRK